jgi:acyl-CoA thioester hydrolase
VAVHRIPIERRFSDLDLLGHVNNVVYYDYLQESRLRLLTLLGREKVEAAPLVVAHQEIDYIAPLPGGVEPVIVETWIDRIGTSSFTVAAVVWDSDGTLAARASTVMVFFDRATEKSKPMSKEVRHWLEGGLREEEKEEL